MRPLLPDTVFARLTWLIVLGFALSQIVIALLFWAGIGHTLPAEPHRLPGTTDAAAVPHPLPPLPWQDVLLDQSIQLFFVLLAVWLGTRWIVRPIEKLARDATRLQNEPTSAPLQPEGPYEVRQAATALNQMRQRILYHLLERQNFLAAISHDLRTPLTRMRLRAEILQPVSVRERTRADIAEMTEMLDMVLDFLRGQAITEPLQALDIQSLVETIAEDHVENGDIVTVSGDARPLMGYPIGLRRVLENLVGNALRYGKRADICLIDAPQSLRIDIQDQGPGMSAEEMKRVLEPFVRLESSLGSDSGGGFGLGLTIARDIVRQHGGSLTLAAISGAGLRVSVSLPRTVSEAGAKG